MTKQIQKKKINKKSGVNPVAAAFTGLIIGAGAAVAGAIVLNDKNNREKIATAVTDVNNNVKKTMDKAEKKVKKILV